MSFLKVENLVVRLGDPERTVLDNLSFSVSEPSVVLVLGANGSGKSVLLRTILGLHRIAQGTISVDGAAPRQQQHRRQYKQQRRKIHQRSGVAFQNPDYQIFGDTVADDLRIGRSDGSIPGHPAVEAMGLTPLLNSPPQQLSGGQRRRLVLAGAFAAADDFLFLDEPFIELDYPHILHLVDLITAARDRGTTVLVASHETRDIWDIADQVLLLYQGKGLAFGSIEEVRHHVSPAVGLRPLEGISL